MKPATLANWRHLLDKRLIPMLGSIFLGDVGNGALKELVAQLNAEHLGAKTVVHYVNCAKAVVASAVNPEGEALYPRKWNDDFIQLPIVHKEQQKRPSITAEEMTAIVADSRGRYRVLFATLGGSGVRIGEGLALRTEDFSEDCSVVHIRRSIWKTSVQPPKNANAIREIDLPPELAAFLRRYVASIPAGHLFATKNGTPPQPTQCTAGVTPDSQSGAACLPALPHQSSTGATGVE